MGPNRREFLVSGLGATAPAWVLGNVPERLLIESAPDPSYRRRLAERELLRGLTLLGGGSEIRLAGPGEAGSAGDLKFVLRIEPARFKHPEAYSIAAEAGRVVLTAAGEQALLYAVFDFLERQGAFFGIDGESYPLEPAGQLVLPPAGRPWRGEPDFTVRGLLPWPDFLNCITVYNEEDFRAYFESMLRMRFNTFGMHVYTGANQWAESYLSFEFGGVGHLGFLDTTASHRWGYLPQRTSTFGMGAAQFYDGEVFGSDATRFGRDPWETAERTRKLLRDALNYARRLGMRTGIGFEPYQIPDEIWRALPPEVKPERAGDRPEPGARFDIESVTAKDLLEARLAQLLEAYPEVEHVWLWEDEGMNWESRRTGQALSVTPFLQAHSFLQRHAPKKKLVVSGWGGVARHFADFHRRLPGDVVFSCLSDTLGWDPVHEVFGRLEGRERWPIPWLEDDPAMWLPQFHVHRFRRDLNLARQYGCQGVLGIHWRHRIVDPTAAYQARFSWDRNYTPAAHYAAFARSQAAGGRAARLAEVMDAADRDRKLLSTWTGEIKDGHAVQHAYSGDYGEAFAFWSNYEPDPKVMQAQEQVAAALRQIAGSAGSALERERLEYLARHVEFLGPYARAWVLAHRMHGKLQEAAELKKEGRREEARALVAGECLPMWLELAPEVRKAILDFQRVAATRSDQGTLASLHNKFARLALVRLRLSMKEFLGELPPETESMYRQVLAPDPEVPPRLFLPTRPSMLAKGEKARVLILAVGPAPVRAVTLHTRLRGAAGWTASPAKLLGRRTWQATLGPFEPGAAIAEYYASAEAGRLRLTAPPDAPGNRYLITLA